MPNCLGLENSFGILYDSVGALVQEVKKKVYLLHFLSHHGICLLTLYDKKSAYNSTGVGQCQWHKDFTKPQCHNIMARV